MIENRWTDANLVGIYSYYYDTKFPLTSNITKTNLMKNNMNSSIKNFNVLAPIF